jgi:hypothetical protein
MLKPNSGSLDDGNDLDFMNWNMPSTNAQVSL